MKSDKTSKTKSTKKYYSGYDPKFKTAHAALEKIEAEMGWKDLFYTILRYQSNRDENSPYRLIQADEVKDIVDRNDLKTIRKQIDRLIEQSKNQTILRAQQKDLERIELELNDLTSESNVKRYNELMKEKRFLESNL